MITHSSRAVGMALATLAISIGICGPAQSQKLRNVTLYSGTVIPVKLDTTLNSKDVQKGDKFTATVTKASKYNESTGLPIGTKVQGVVQSAEPMEGKNPGTLDLAFNRVTLPNGRSYSISGSPIGLDNKSIVYKNGRMVAKKGNKGPNRLTYVGIGAGAGLLLNVLGHRKGTLTDVLIGAGLGYAAGSLIKGGSSPRDVNLKEGTTLGVSLDRNVAIAR
jgi:hypothetical protein